MMDVFDVRLLGYRTYRLQDLWNVFPTSSSLQRVLWDFGSCVHASEKRGCLPKATWSAMDSGKIDEAWSYRVLTSAKLSKYALSDRYYPETCLHFCKHADNIFCAYSNVSTRIHMAHYTGPWLWQIPFRVVHYTNRPIRPILNTLRNRPTHYHQSPVTTHHHCCCDKVTFVATALRSKTISRIVNRKSCESEYLLSDSKQHASAGVLVNSKQK